MIQILHVFKNHFRTASYKEQEKLWFEGWQGLRPLWLVVGAGRVCVRVFLFCFLSSQSLPISDKFYSIWMGGLLGSRCRIIDNVSSGNIIMLISVFPSYIWGYFTGWNTRRTQSHRRNKRIRIEINWHRWHQSNILYISFYAVVCVCVLLIRVVIYSIHHFYWFLNRMVFHSFFFGFHLSRSVRRFCVGRPTMAVLRSLTCFAGSLNMTHNNMIFIYK